MRGLVIRVELKGLRYLYTKSFIPVVRSALYIQAITRETKKEEEEHTPLTYGTGDQ